MKKNPIFLLAAAAILFAVGISSALASDFAAPRYSHPYPTECVDGPVNTVAPNYIPQSAPPGYCEVCAMVSVKNSLYPGGEQLIGEICNLTDYNMSYVYSIMQRVMYCGAVLPAHGWEDFGRAWSPPLMVDAQRLWWNCQTPSDDSLFSLPK